MAAYIDARRMIRNQFVAYVNAGSIYTEKNSNGHL